MVYSMKRLCKKIFILAGVWVCFTGSLNVCAAGKQVGTFAGHPVFDNEMSGIEIQDGGESGLQRRGAAFPSRLDPRSNGTVAKVVEDQGETNTCWAFATIAAIESNLIKKGYADENINLSENHLAYFFYNRQNDPLGYTEGDKNNIGRNSTWDMNGGTLYGTALALNTWSGVVNEGADEDKNGMYAPKNLPAQDCYKSDYRVLGSYFYNYRENTVKQAIMDYGAVAIGICWSSAFFNERSNAYFCWDEDAIGNHAVAIVGWDDNYSWNELDPRHRPEKNGAWIVKNSYGANFGEGGYIYVSYEDKSLEEVVAYDMAPAAQSYTNNYQYDGSANPAAYWQFSQNATVANVFNVKGSGQGYNEVLKAVSIDLLTTNVRYSLQIYAGVTGADPTNGTKMLSQPQTGLLVNGGYNRIELNTPVTLAAGEKYSVVFTLSTGGGADVCVGADGTQNASWINFVAKVKSGQGYAYANGRWYDMGKVSDVLQSTGTFSLSNFRIKAYTDNTTEKPSYKLSEKSIGISRGGTAKLSLQVTPSSVKRTVTWSSSDKKVATVSSSGKVKAKAYGTATIKAKFVAGSKTKTLTCKVTVGPSKVKGFKVKAGKKKITVTWKKNNAASGYVIYYSQKKNSGYKKLGTVNNNKTVKLSKGKLKKGTYYVKMRPYLSRNGKKLYGSYTAVKTVKVK